MRRLRFLPLALMTGALVAFVAACGGGDDNGGDGVSGDISIMAIWSGAEQRSFQAVIDGFTEENPDVNVRYTSGGDQLPTQLSTAIEGGNPPDLAAIAQPGLMSDFADRGAIEPIAFIEETLVDGFGDSVTDIGRVDGTLYGLLFKAANKSTVWYNVQTFEDAGVEPPQNWDEFLEAAQTLGASGVPAYSIGGADGWTLTDLFENIYVRTAGPDLYDQLAAHEIPWTHESVKTALREMAKVLGDRDNIAGGAQGALQTEFPTSVTNVFSASPRAAMVIEGDFVPTAAESALEPQTGFNVFDFPAIEDSPPSVVGGGDMFVMFTDNDATRAFVEYLATPEAAQIWAERGGFSSPSKDLDASVYPDPILQETAGAISEAEVFKFDLSDLQPAAFGATVGQGMWGLFQDFLRNPDNVDGISQQLEQAAARAYSS